MAKNLKDIVDEGFSRLALLADKRSEILQRSESIANAATGPQSVLAEKKLSATEQSYKAEISTQLERLMDDLKLTLVQVAENNQIYLSSVKENLRLRIAILLNDLEKSHEYTQSITTQKLESITLQLEKDFEANSSELRSESVKLLGDLESLCKRSQSWLHQSQAEISGKIACNEHEFTGLLGEAFGSLVQQAEERRRNVSDALEVFYRKQDEQMAAATEDLNQRTSLAVTNSLNDLDNLCKESEQKLKDARDKTIATATEKLQSLTQDSIAELQDSCDYSKKELNEKLNEIREFSSRLLEQVDKSLLEMDALTRISGEKYYEELKNFSEGQLLGSLRRTPIEAAFANLSNEFSILQSDFKRKLEELLKNQGESMNGLCATTDRTFADMSTEIKSQLIEMIKVQEQLQEQREDELVRRLENIEKQIDETYKLLEGVGTADSNGGGKK